VLLLLPVLLVFLLQLRLSWNLRDHPIYGRSSFPWISSLNRLRQLLAVPMHLMALPLLLLLLLGFLLLLNTTLTVWRLLRPNTVRTVLQRLLCL
jgi:hypothetical protein